MNKKEFLLVILTTMALVWSGYKFTSKGSYDCVQPLFSNLSSCTFYGAECMYQRNHPGINGLVKNAGFFQSDNKVKFNLVPSDFKIECQAPNCNHSKDCYYLVKPYSTFREKQ